MYKHTLYTLNLTLYKSTLSSFKALALTLITSLNLHLLLHFTLNNVQRSRTHTYTMLFQALVLSLLFLLQALTLILSLNHKPYNVQTFSMLFQALVLVLVLALALALVLALTSPYYIYLLSNVFL